MISLSTIEPIIQTTSTSPDPSSQGNNENAYLQAQISTTEDVPGFTSDPAFRKSHGIDEPLFYVFGVLGMIISVLGIVGNIVCIIVYSRRGTIKRNSSFLFLALSVFDMLYLTAYLVFGVLQVTLYKLKETIIGKEAESYVDAVSCIMVTGSVFITAALTVERCIAITKPLRWSFICSRRHSYILVATLTVITFIVNFPLFLGDSHYTKTTQHIGNQSKSASIYSDSFERQGVYFVAHLRAAWYLKFILPTFQLLIPGVIICICTFCIIFNIRRHRVGLASDSNPGYNVSVLSKSANRITSQVIVMAGISLLSNGFLASSFIVTAVNGPWVFDECSLFCVVYVSISHILVATNSSINFFLYLCFSKWFRDDVKMMMRCKKNVSV